MRRTAVAVSCNGSGRRPSKPTPTPSRASRRAVARPTPLPAPVISATLPRRAVMQAPPPELLVDPPGHEPRHPSDDRQERHAQRDGRLTRNLDRRKEQGLTDPDDHQEDEGADDHRKDDRRHPNLLNQERSSSTSPTAPARQAKPTLPGHHLTRTDYGRTGVAGQLVVPPIGRTGSAS